MLIQKNKSFNPHVMVVEVGSAIEFPNRDPFFHNVFSLFDGKRFDLGLYEAGTSRTVCFDRPGICYIFCNIHPDMSAVVIVVNTPYFGVSDRSGRVSVPDVPRGRYELHLWHERSLPQDLQKLAQEVVIKDDPSTLGELRIPLSGSIRLTHKNKYGRDYDPPSKTTYSNP